MPDPFFGRAKPDPWADRIGVRRNGRVVAERAPSPRARRDNLRCVALRHGPGSQTRRTQERCAIQGVGAPAALAWLRRKLTGSDDCDRQMVAILAIVLTDGLPAVDAACAEAICDGTHSSDVIINILACQRPRTGIVHRAARRSKEDTRARLL
jgi:hypothetical protein